MFIRLAPRLEELRISIRQRTGDSSYINVQKPPQVLITTPESFDVLLSREPRMFITVQAVVLDEIHLLDNSSRGDQLRILLNRLRILRWTAYERKDAKNESFQTVLLSATVSSPKEVADRYCQNAQIIEVPGKREIEAELTLMKDETDVLAAISTFRTRQIRKALVFCNSRAECERHADFLRTYFAKEQFNLFGENIFVHHSSLDKEVRRMTEERFSSAQVGICFATSTVELGIDIGDIDLVILIAPPSDLGSFLQRIGRGSRRTNKTMFWGFYRNEKERLLFQTLLELSTKASQTEKNYAFRPSVIIQQILSYLQQRKNGAFTAKDFKVLLEKPTGGYLLNQDEQDYLLSHLVAEQILIQTPRNEYTSGDKANNIYEKFQQYSNIESGGRGVKVIDELTGKVLGKIEDKDLQGKETFTFGGQKLNVVRNEINKLIVTNNPEKSVNKHLKFLSSRAPLPFDLARKIAIHVGIKETEFLLFQTNGKWILIHALGTVYGRMLAQLLTSQNVWKAKADDLCLIGDSYPSKITFEFESRDIRNKLQSTLKGYEKLLNLGKFQKQLPENLRQKTVELSFDITDFCEATKGKKVVEVTSNGNSKNLAAFIPVI